MIKSFDIGLRKIADAFEKRAMDLLIKQCDFGPRHPGSEGHEKMKIYFEKFHIKYKNIIKNSFISKFQEDL